MEDPRDPLIEDPLDPLMEDIDEQPNTADPFRDRPSR